MACVGSIPTNLNLFLVASTLLVIIALVRNSLLKTLETKPLNFVREGNSMWNKIGYISIAVADLVFAMGTGILASGAPLT